MARALTHCPKCGQRVTPFAAGCAVCGTDLEAARAARAARRDKARFELPAIGWPRGAGRGRIDWIQVVIAVILALGAPPIGLLLALYWASRAHRDGEPVKAVVMLAVAALAAAAIFAPEWFFSHLY